MNSKFKLSVFVTTFLTLFSLSSMAQDDIELGQPGYGGSGCPSGSASATLSPDKKSLSLIFDEFLVEAGGETRRRIARKSCNLAIPVRIPQGLSISVIQVDYRGYNYLPRGDQQSLMQNTFLLEAKDLNILKLLEVNFDDEYIIENALPIEAMVWSPCGEDVNLRVNTQA